MSEVLYKYEEKSGDYTKQLILLEERKRGFEHKDPLEIDESFIKLYNDLLYNLKEITSDANFNYSPTNPNYVQRSIRLWKKLGIPLYPVLHFQNLDKTDTNKIDAFRKNSKIKKVSRIPIEIREVIDNVVQSYIDETCVDVNDYTFTFVNKIVISDINNYISSCIYNHEVVHTQQIYNRGYSNNILDDETLPIFFEEIFAIHLDPSFESLNQLRNRRLYYMFDHFYDMFFKEDINYRDIITMDMYIKSTMQAINMVNIFLKSNSKIKKELLKDIKKIFSYDRTLQDILKKYESELNNVTKDVNELRRVKW